MPNNFPSKLKKGDTVALIAPSSSYAKITPDVRKIAQDRFKELGLNLVYGKNIEIKDEFDSSSIAERISDLHQAFANKEVKAIIAIMGGFNVNQILPFIDWKLIKNNPKIVCGYSDITALTNAIYAKTGLVTYSGPNLSSFGQKLNFEYTLKSFKYCLMSEKSYMIKSSEKWSDDSWYKDQDKRSFNENTGYVVLNKGNAEGTIVGGNLSTLPLLFGTEYMPSIKDAILFIEDDNITGEFFALELDRKLESLLQQPNANKIKGLVFGRFESSAKMDMEKLSRILKNKAQLKNIPIIANVDFGHTDPSVTFPIGGTAKITAGKNVRIEVIKH